LFRGNYSVRLASERIRRLLFEAVLRHLRGGPQNLNAALTEHSPFIFHQVR
jgi:hypothetical protein